LGRPLVGYQFDIGHSIIDPVKRGDPITLPKASTTVFELTDKRLNNIHQVLQRRAFQLSDLTKAEITIVQVEFADKTMWFGSQWFKFNESTGKLDRVST
jgi:hypothetical protein